MKYIIVVDKQPRTNPSSERKEYEIDIDELLKKSDVHDDFKIEDGIARVYRRIGLTKTHVTYVLDKEVIEELNELKIKLFKGDNYVYLKDQNSNQVCAEYIVESDFTKLYATKVEMNSTIEQTAQSIDLSVNKKLEGYSTTQEMQSAINMKVDSIELKVNNTLKDYSTTEEMNSAIQLKADSITSTVSKSYATKNELNTAKTEIKQTTDAITSTVSKKVGNDEIISKINQSAESVAIDANKISLKRKRNRLNKWKHND